jgi:uncharacterized membrane protein
MKIIFACRHLLGLAEPALVSDFSHCSNCSIQSSKFTVYSSDMKSTSTGKPSVRDKIFHTGIILKAADGFVESALGLVIAFSAEKQLHRFILDLAVYIGQIDSDSPLLDPILHASHFGNSGREWFVATYLTAHGLIKLVLATALLRRIRVAFPIAIAVLIALFGFQAVRLVHHFSWLLLILSLIDIAIVISVYYEYQSLSKTARYPVVNCQVKLPG